MPGMTLVTVIKRPCWHTLIRYCPALVSEARNLHVTQLLNNNFIMQYRQLEHCKPKARVWLVQLPSTIEYADTIKDEIIARAGTIATRIAFYDNFRWICWLTSGRISQFITMTNNTEENALLSVEHQSPCSWAHLKDWQTMNEYKSHSQ